MEAPRVWVTRNLATCSESVMSASRCQDCSRADTFVKGLTLLAGADGSSGASSRGAAVRGRATLTVCMRSPCSGGTEASAVFDVLAGSPILLPNSSRPSARPQLLALRLHAGAHVSGH